MPSKAYIGAKITKQHYEVITIKSNMVVAICSTWRELSTMNMGEVSGMQAAWWSTCFLSMTLFIFVLHTSLCVTFKFFLICRIIATNSHYSPINKLQFLQVFGNSSLRIFPQESHKIIGKTLILSLSYFIKFQKFTK
jgi:hypothetical protein